MDQIGDLWATLGVELGDEVAGHHFGNFFSTVGQVALELQENLPRIAHPKHAPRSASEPGVHRFTGYRDATQGKINIAPNATEPTTSDAVVASSLVSTSKFPS